MKKTFLSIILLAAAANAGAIDMKAVKHAHPLPNFMIVIIQQGDMLALSPEQAQVVANWRAKHGPIAKKLVMAINKGEQELEEASLNGTSKEKIMAQLDALLEMRRQLAEMKTTCRDNLRQILSEEQWNELVSLYKEML